MDKIDLSQLTTSGITWTDGLLALAFAIAGWVTSIFVHRGVLAVLRKTPNVTEGIAVLVARVVKYGLVLLGAGIGLSFLGASLQPVLAVTLILAVVAVLVLRGVADNFAAGVLLQTRHPVTIGDEIEVNGNIGTVSELNGRSVVLHTLDGRTIRVPNAQLISEPIVNHSERGARRSEVQVRVLFDGIDIPALFDLLADAASHAEGVHSREAARSLAISVSPERITVRVQFWHHPLKGVPVTSAVVLSVGQALKTARIAGTVTSAPGDPPLVTPDRP